MADTDNLASTLTDDTEGTGNLAAAATANTAPDIGANLPSAPATALPATAPPVGAPSSGPQPDLPRFQRTFGNTLKGIAMGWAMNGLPGAIAGGVNPQGVQRVADNQAAIAAANQHFASARAAHETAQAALLEKQVNAFDEEHQQSMEKIGLDNLKAAQEAGFKIVGVTPLDGQPEDNAKAAMNNLQQIQKNNGGKVPEGLLHIHAGNGNGIYTLQLQDPAAALGIVNQTRRAQGLPELDSNTFLGLSPQERQAQAKDAINFTNPTDPQTGQISQTSVTTLENRLALVKAQPAFNGQDALVASLQKNLDFQKSALEHEATRKGQAAGAQAGAEAQAAQPGQTAAKVAEINATAGPEAAAAGAKAKAIAKGTAEGQIAGGGGPQTDSLGATFTPPAGGIKEINKVKDSFKKDADELAKTEGTYGMFNNVLEDINAGKEVTGSKSVVALFNAIGLSATPLKGMGMRINSNTVQEHIGARGLGQSIYQKLLSLKNGDVITPQQIKDYADIALQARHDAYVNKINEVRSQGVDPSFLLPRGNGRKLDPNTGSIFYDVAGGTNPQEKAANAVKAAKSMGWL